jgi:hypothetical protein
VRRYLRLELSTRSSMVVSCQIMYCIKNVHVFEATSHTMQQEDFWPSCIHSHSVTRGDWRNFQPPDSLLNHDPIDRRGRQGARFGR